MGRKILNFFYLGRQFKKEFKKQLRLLIVVSFAFTMAFTWRQTTFDLSQSLVQFFFHIQNSDTLSVLSSILITIASIFFILLTSYILKDHDEY